MDFAARLVLTIDEGGPISGLGGVHVGCFELFGGNHIRTISDLKGKSVGVHLLGRPHAFLGAAAAHMGSTRCMIFTGLPKPSPIRSNCLPRARSTPFSA